MDADIIVIGAGLAGLQCARRAERHGHSVIVLEAGDAAGGRVQTDRIDGFLCDKGFQLLNPAYPSVRKWIDTSSLELQKFGFGVVVRDGEATSTLAHPVLHPAYALETLRSKQTQPRDLLAMARWLGPTLLRPSRVYDSARDTTLSTSFDAAGLIGRLRSDVLDTFLAGVLADASGEVSADYARLLMRFFVLSAPGLPRAGMQALPQQMADSLSAPVRFGVAGRDLQETSDGVRVTTDSGTLSASSVVVAVGSENVADLTPLTVPVTRGLTTWWFRAPELPRRGPFLMLDASRPGGGPTGPIWHTAVVSEAAPSYAPTGHHLIEATTLLDQPDGLATEGDIRRDLERLYSTSTKDWDVLAHHVVQHALPLQPPPLRDRHPQWTGPRVLVTGDHRGTGSIDGALLAGDRAGEAVSERLAS